MRLSMTCRICDLPCRELPYTITPLSAAGAAFHCQHCGHLQTALNVPLATVEAQYTVAPYCQAYSAECGDDALDARAEAHAQTLLAECRKRGLPARHLRVCDVGTGQGWFLRALARRESHWSLFGVDICEESRLRAEEFVGFGHVARSISDFAEPFDAVTCFDLLEHLVDPRSLLREVYTRLAPRGILLCVNPGWNVWDTVAVRSPRRLGLPLIRRRLSSAHVSVFSTTSISTLLQRTGFTLLAVRRFTDIGRSFGRGHGALGSVFGAVTRFLALVGLAPRNRLLAIATKQ